MQFIFAGVSFFGVIATMIFIKSLELSLGLTVILVIPLVIFAVYSIARIRPAESKAEKVP